MFLPSKPYFELGHCLWCEEWWQSKLRTFTSGGLQRSVMMSSYPRCKDMSYLQAPFKLQVAFRHQCSMSKDKWRSNYHKFTNWTNIMPCTPFSPQIWEELKLFLFCWGQGNNLIVHTISMPQTMSLSHVFMTNTTIVTPINTTSMSLYYHNYPVLYHYFCPLSHLVNIFITSPLPANIPTYFFIYHCL